MTATPLISILLPSYNYGRYVGSTIESVLAQTCPDFELIVSDDASTDNSREIIRKYRDPRVRFVEQPQNLGNIRHFAAMYALCRGEFVAYIDSDDLWAPEKLERQLAAFRADPGLALVATHIRTIDSNGQPRPADDSVAEWFNQSFDLNDWASWVHQNRICMSSILARKAAHDAVGVRRPDLTLVADLDLWLRFRAQGYRLGLIEEPLTTYRVHPHGMWGRRSRDTLPQQAFTTQAVLHPALRAAGREDLVRASVAAFLNDPALAEFSPAERAIIIAALSAPQPRFAEFAEMRATLQSPASLDDLATAIDTLTNVYADARRWQQEISNALNFSHARIAHHELDLTNHRREASELRLWIEDLQAAAEHARAQAAATHEQLESSRRENAELREWVAALQQTRADDEGSLQRARADYATARERIAELEAALDREFLSRTTAEQQARHLEAELDSLRSDHNELQDSEWFRAAAAGAMQAARLRAESAALDPAIQFHLEQQFVEPARREFVAKGWAFLPGNPALSLRARVISTRQTRSALATLFRRPDVAAAFPAEKGAADSGFIVWAPLFSGNNIILLEVRRGDAWSIIHRQSIEVGFRHPAPTPTRPSVAVVIPCFNYGRFVREAVESALAQTWPHLEVVVVDDGSTETDTIAVLDSLCHPRLRVLRTPNRGLPAARNHGIRATGATYICCLDADDKLAPTYVEKTLFVLTATGTDIAGSWQQNFGLDQSIHCPGEFTLENLWSQNQLINVSLYSRRLWEEVGGYDESFTVGYEDWEFWLRCARAGARASVVPEPLFLYRKHGPSMLDRVRARHDEVVQRLRAIHYHGTASAKFAADLPSGVDTARALLGPPPVPATTPASPHVILALPWLVLGGVDTFLSQICGHLVSQGVRLTVLTTERPLPKQGDATALFTAFTPEIYHLPRFVEERHWPAFLHYLVRSREATHLWIAGSAFAYHQLPSLHEHFPRLTVFDLLFNTEGHTANNRRFAHHLDLTLCENGSIRDWLLARDEWPERIRVIPNGVDLQRFRPGDRLAARAALGVSPEAFVVGFLGRFSHEKAPDAFLHLAAAFRDDATVQFVLAGAGPAEAGLRELAKELGPLNVNWPGVVNSAQILPGIDVLVVPSRLDGRPNAVLEAMACGVPVIASHVGGLPELVEDGTTGFLVPPLDLHALGTAVRSLRENPTLRSTMAVAAREYAERRLDVREAMQSYAALFKEPRS